MRTGGLDPGISSMYGQAPYIAIIDLDPNGNIVATDIVPNPAVDTLQRVSPITTQ